MANTLFIIDTLSNTVSASRVVTAPFGVGFSPDGTLAYISSEDKVLVMDTATLKFVRSYTVGGTPTSVLVSANGRWLITDNSSLGRISEIDTDTGTVNRIEPAGASGRTTHGIVFAN